MASPNMGDLGLVESLTQRDLNNEAIDEQTVQNIRREQSAMNARDTEIQRYIRTASIQFTEEEMRAAENQYVVIDENKQQDAENVAEDGEQSEEEKKEEGQDVTSFDEPTLLAKAIRTGSIGSQPLLVSAQSHSSNSGSVSRQSEDTAESSLVDANLKVKRSIDEVPKTEALSEVLGDVDPAAARATERAGDSEDEEEEDGAAEADAPFEEVKL